MKYNELLSILLEHGTIDFAFCTLTTTKDLKKNHILKKEDLIAKRPNIGDFLAEDIELLIGKKINSRNNRISWTKFSKNIMV